MLSFLFVIVTALNTFIVLKGCNVCSIQMSDNFRIDGPRTPTECATRVRDASVTTMRGRGADAVASTSFAAFYDDGFAACATAREEDDERDALDGLNARQPVGASTSTRGRARGRRRPSARFTWLVLACVASLAPNAVRAQFEKATDYPYRVCSEQPGAYAGPNGTTDRASCVSLDAGELGFCTGIAWDACVRTDPPALQDKRVLGQYEELTKKQLVMAPELANDPDCLVVMAEYMCALAFPRCDPNPNDALTYYELPACWDYCMNSVFGCTGDMAIAQNVCNASLASGVVVESGRSDVRCTSAAARYGTGVVLFTLSIALAAV